MSHVNEPQKPNSFSVGLAHRAPKGVEMLLDDMREAIEFGRPFVEEEETREESNVRE